MIVRCCSLVPARGTLLPSTALSAHSQVFARKGEKLRRERDSISEYARKPFEPEPSAASLAAANVTLADPLAAKGKIIFEAQSCNVFFGLLLRARSIEGGRNRQAVSHHPGYLQALQRGNHAVPAVRGGPDGLPIGQKDAVEAARLLRL